MRFDRVDSIKTYGYDDEPFFESYSGLSCAFGDVSCSYSNDENLCWEQFCYILTQTKENNRPTFVPITDKEHKMRDLFDACPYAICIAKAKSRHGDYNAYVYLLEIK